MLARRIGAADADELMHLFGGAGPVETRPADFVLERVQQNSYGFDELLTPIPLHRQALVGSMPRLTNRETTVISGL